ncbi:MAG: hypothetical protein U0T82_08770 [Bacteroidales bacterium]
MKSFFSAPVLLLFASLVTAQDFITYTGKGLIVLSTGDSLEGYLEYSLSYPASVRIKVADNKTEKLKASEVKEFFLNEYHYFPVQFKGEMVVGGDFSFAILLNSEKARIRLYKYECQPKVVAGDNIPHTVTYHCAPSMENNEVYPLSHSLVNPSKN